MTPRRTTPAPRPLRFVSLLSLVALAGALVPAACGGSTTTGDDGQAVSPGDPCDPGDDPRPAKDGCNTCACGEGGTWSCTEIACASDGGAAACDPGEKREGADGCNTCVCGDDGAWVCTRMDCVSDGGGGVACPAPAKPDPGTGCVAVVTYAVDPESGLCCEYPDPCSAPPGWKQTFDATACGGGGSPGTCQEGAETVSPDGCNLCTCTGGAWACTKKGCAPPPVCKDGESTYDGCNSCTCMGGQWGCTARACPPPECKDGDVKVDPCSRCECLGGAWLCSGGCMDAGPPARGCGGWLGDTCLVGEYCAYEDGQLCGAADASAYCAPRPDACDAVLDPVCGCDGFTYENACLAAAKGGTGVYSKGPCSNGR